MDVSGMIEPSDESYAHMARAVDAQLKNRSNPALLGDTNLYVTFHDEAILDAKTTEEAHKLACEEAAAKGEAPPPKLPKYKTVPFVRIMNPGDRTNMPDREAILSGQCSDIARFPREYAMYRNKSAEGVVGTPLRVLTMTYPPQLSVSQVEELRFVGCVTVEMLAGMSEGNLSKFMGGHDMQAKAKRWLEVQKEVQGTHERMAELEKRDRQIDALTAQSREKDARLDRLEALLRSQMEAQASAAAQLSVPPPPPKQATTQKR